ncbi:MAG TPA: biotin--[acetyl-CoA-carboxylase] ligase [Chloroflexota bacterium]|nr:biotin--[acetyl-CoA-carboxylase] ligase [Chloroflexota bacterium]
MNRDDAAVERWIIPSGWTLNYAPLTDSTNDDAKRAARDGARDRTLFVADEQRRGRGRMGRTWVSPPGSGLLFSLVLRRDLPPVDLTALCSISVVEAIADATGLSARIKWPNDVMLGEKKACGLLTEVVPQTGGRATIVGIGINVTAHPDGTGLGMPVTSLAEESTAAISRPSLLRAILERIDRRYAREDASLFADLRSEWERLLWRKRQTVRVSQDGPTVEGIVEGIAPSGALVLRRDDTRLIEISVGDVFAV